MGPGDRGLLSDYSRQALTYDQTRSASPSVVAALRDALRESPGRRLADIGGGTGNYALALAGEGWSPLVIDRSPEMLGLAREKGLETLAARAEQLPVEDESFDAATMISMLHHTDDPLAALAEAKRILSPGGVLAVKMYTREDIEGSWLIRYFPASREWMLETHPPFSFFAEELPGAERQPLRFDDLEDASLAALSSRPELLLEEHWRRQTSYFERLERDHPDELRDGLERLEGDVRRGDPPSGVATTTLIRWQKG